MTIKKNEMKKVFANSLYTHYVVFMACNPAYKNYIDNDTADDLTDEEYECVSRIVDEDMRVRAIYAFTEEVFGAPAHLDLPL